MRQSGDRIGDAEQHAFGQAHQHQPIDGAAHRDDRIAAEPPAGRAEQLFADGLRFLGHAGAVAIQEEQGDEREHQDGQAACHLDPERARHVQNSAGLGVAEERPIAPGVARFACHQVAAVGPT